MGNTECTYGSTQIINGRLNEVEGDVTVNQVGEEMPNPLQSHFQLKHPMSIRTLTMVNTKSGTNEQLSTKQNLPKSTDQLSHNSSSPIQQKKPLPRKSPNKGARRVSAFKQITINLEDLMKVREERIEKFYEMKEKIGEGSFGQVYRAVCLKSGEERAIKILKAGSLTESKQNTEFLKEMTLLSCLNHPAIIKLYDLFHCRSKYFVVMEYCRGGAIVDILRKCKKKSQKIIANILKQLLGALAYMHSLNIVHRDIKLDNMVFLNKVDNLEGDQYIPVKIIDFGTAVHCKHRSVHGYPITGTMSYIAPEVLNKTLTAKSDIWSSAVLMHILLTGISPFKDRNQLATKNNIVNKKLHFNQSPLSKLSKPAKDLMERMFNRNYKERISAKDALKHEWFQDDLNTVELSHSHLQRLQHFERGNNLLAVIQTYLCMRKIDQDERQRYAQIFSAIDGNGNGLIETEQLLAVYKKNGGSMDSESVKHILKHIDGDHSGKIDFNEFLIAMQSREKLFHREALSEAFQYFDRDRTGYLEKDEIRSLLKGSEKTEVECMIAELDTDGDSKISKEEFINYLLAQSRPISLSTSGK